MNRPAVVGILLLLPLLCFAQGIEKSEFSLKELGYGGFEAKGVEKSSCMEFVFSIPDPNEGFFPIISINAEFTPKGAGEAAITLFLNDALVREFKPGGFRCETGECWARVEIERERVEENNTLKACLKTGKSVTGVKLSSESLIGYYQRPAFKAEDFRKCILLETGECVESYEASLGEDLNITLSLLNSGTALSFVDLNSRVVEAGTRPSRKEIGETHFEGILYPGKTAEITYTIRVEKPDPMGLAPGVAVYKNAFGESETITSNQVFIQPKAGIEVSVSIGIESVDQAGKEAVLSFTFFNRERTLDAGGLQASIILGEGLELAEGTGEIAAGSIEPRQAFSTSFKVKALEQGDFTVGCTYSGNGIPEENCEQVLVSFREENPALLIGATIAILVIGGAIYLFIHTREEYSE